MRRGRALPAVKGVSDHCASARRPAKLTAPQG